MCDGWKEHLRGPDLCPEKEDATWSYDKLEHDKVYVDQCDDTNVSLLTYFHKYLTEPSG